MARRMAVEDVSGLLSLRSSGCATAEKNLKKVSDKSVRGKNAKRVAMDKSPASGSPGAKRARMDGKPEAAGGSGSSGASDTVMSDPVVNTIMAIMGTATSMGKSTAKMVVNAWKRPQEWDNFLPEKKKFVKGMIDLCGAEYSNIKSAAAQYDIIQMAEAERKIDEERREKKLRKQQHAAMAAESIRQSNQVGAGAKKTVKGGANEATDTSSVSGQAAMEIPPPKMTFETEPATSVMTTPKNVNKHPKYRGASSTSNYTKIVPAPGIAKVKDGAELFMECIYNAMEIDIPATGAVDILGSICNESNDGSYTKRKEVPAGAPKRAGCVIKEEDQDDGELICPGAEPAIILPHLGGQDLLLPNNNPGPSKGSRQDGSVSHAASNKMDSDSLVWDNWENVNNLQLLRSSILMTSKHDAVTPSIWTLTERGIPPYRECPEGFVRIPFLFYAHSVAPALDKSEHLFAHRLWFCHYVKPPLVFRSDNSVPEEVIHCRTIILAFVMSNPYTVPWVKSLNKFLSDLRDLERRCKLAMDNLFRKRGGCNRDDYILFVGWIDYTVRFIMEEQMGQCKLPCSEFDPQIAYPMRHNNISRLSLNHINACVIGERFTYLDKKKETREQMTLSVFSVMNPNERAAVEEAHVILEDATMAGSNLPMTERMAEVVRAYQTVMPTLKSFYGKVSIQLAAEMSEMLERNPETMNDRLLTQRISTASE